MKKFLLLAAALLMIGCAESKKDQAYACHLNLQAIQHAITQKAMEDNEGNNTAVTMEGLLKYFHNDEAPSCPSGGKYSVTTTEADPTCSVEGHSIH